MNNNQKIEVGQKVLAIVWAWREDETPSDKNFAIGIVSEVFERSENAVYVRIKGIDRIIPLDRIQAV